MKKLYKGLIAAVLIAAAVLSTVVPAYATAAVVDALMGDLVKDVLRWCLTPTTVNEGEDDLIAAKNYLDSVWRLESNASGTVDVTYQSLSDVVSQLNMNGVPCQIKQLRGAGVTGYVIMGTGTTTVLDGYGRYDLTRKYFTNTAGAMFRADKDSGGSSDVTVDTSGIIQMLMTIQSAIAGVDNSLGTIISGLSSFSANVSNSLWNIGQTLADFYYYSNLHLEEISTRIQSAGDHLGTIESYLQIYLADMAADIHTTALESTRIRSAVENIEDYALNISTYTAGAYNGVNTIADLIVGWPEKFDQMNNYLLGIGSNSSDIYLTNKSILSAVDSIKTNTAAILSKLNNLTVSATSDYDDTALLEKLDSIYEMEILHREETYSSLNAISSAMQMFGGRLSSISQNTGALLDLFSLGETQTIEPGQQFVFSTDLSSIQTISVKSGSPSLDRAGFVFFSKLPYFFPRVDITIEGLSQSDMLPSIGQRPGLRASHDFDETSFYFSDRGVGSYYPFDGLLSFYDASGDLIHIKEGDLICPTATVGVWEVARAAGGTVEIASCTGLPDDVAFSDLFYPCALVPIRDLVSSPSLFASYCRQVGSGELLMGATAGCNVVNYGSSPLTVEYVTPSPLLNWYANRQDDFRYWLDTRLNNLPVGKPTDLTAVTSRLDTIISALQEAPGDAACDHIYQQDMTTEATCTLPGLMVSTCSNCGDSYSEIIDPLGHDWQCTDHVAAATDPETGEETAAAYDIYTCSRCGDAYNDYSGDGAPEDYSNTSISRLIVELFSRLGKLAGSLMGFVLNVFDKALTGVDDIITKFNSYTEQITGFGGAYPAWLGGLWGILPTELQVALTFAVVCMAVALVGKKLVFS